MNTDKHGFAFILTLITGEIKIMIKSKIKEFGALTPLAQAINLLHGK